MLDGFSRGVHLAPVSLPRRAAGFTEIFLTVAVVFDKVGVRDFVSAIDLDLTTRWIQNQSDPARAARAAWTAGCAVGIHWMVIVEDEWALSEGL